MKKQILFIVILCALNSFSQSSTPNNIWGAAKFIGYNGSNGANPLYTRTNNITRILLNGDQSTNIDGTGLISRNGYMGLGTFTVGGANYWGTNSPFSQLHA